MGANRVSHLFVGLGHVPMWEIYLGLVVLFTASVIGLYLGFREGVKEGGG